MRECIRKTNDEIFGGMKRACKSAVSTTRSRRGLMLGIAVTCIVGLLVGGMGIMISTWPVNTLGWIMAQCVAVIVTAAVCVIIMLYAITLHINCE